MQFAINFLKNNAGVDSPARVVVTVHLIAIAYFGHNAATARWADQSDRLR